MINILRKMVSGPKKRTVWQDFDLDFTYITDRVIAMAFPASGLEKIYRNSIQDVKKYLEEKHPEYLIINVSNRKYNYEVFNNQVEDYFWPDHQVPPLSTIFQICSNVYHYLQKHPNGVVCVHCNHGKGRTGTAIISFLLFSGFYHDLEEVLSFYNKRRFTETQYQVDQPCQIRYLRYMNSVLSLLRKDQNFEGGRLRAFMVKKISAKGLSDGYYLRISRTRDQKIIHKKIPLEEKEGQKMQSIPLIGDIFFQLKKESWSSAKRVARMNANLFFIERLPQKQTDKFIFRLKFNGQSVRVSSEHHKNFSIILDFQEYCQCHYMDELNKSCACWEDRDRETHFFRQMIKFARKSLEISIDDACHLLFFPQQIESAKQEKIASSP